MKRQNIIILARILWSDGCGDEEYLRGMCEIIAYAFPVTDEDTDITVQNIKKEIIARR